jgi:RNA polymerase sigma-70 factor, ECF subfamily
VFYCNKSFRFLYNNMMASQTSFLKYYQKYKDKIYNFFWYRVYFNRSLAEDLTSEVFIKALAHYDGFDHNGSFQAWIYTIARNHFINYCRQAGREVSLESAFQIKDNYLNRINAGIELEKVFAYINELSDNHRDVLLFKFVDGLSNKEIADLLNKEEGAVRTQISRAMATLKEKYEYEQSDRKKIK